MGLAEQWNLIEAGLDPRWSDARLDLAHRRSGAPRPCGRTACAGRPRARGRVDPLRRDARRRRCRTRSGPPHAAPDRRRRHRRHARARSSDASAAAAAPTRASLADDWDAATRGAAGRLERPALRARAHVVRSHRARRVAARTDQPDPERRHDRLPLPLRAHVRLRRVRRRWCGAASRDSTRTASPARCACCARSRTRIRSARKGPSGTSAAKRSEVPDLPDPVAWTVVEPGWRVLDASGDEIGHVAEVLGDRIATSSTGST